jgi:hypothetical protein
MSKQQPRHACERCPRQVQFGRYCVRCFDIVWNEEQVAQRTAFTEAWLRHLEVPELRAEVRRLQEVVRMFCNADIFESKGTQNPTWVVTIDEPANRRGRVSAEGTTIQQALHNASRPGLAEVVDRSCGLFSAEIASQLSAAGEKCGMLLCFEQKALAKCTRCDHHYCAGCLQVHDQHCADGTSVASPILPASPEWDACGALERLYRGQPWYLAAGVTGEGLVFCYVTKGSRLPKIPKRIGKVRVCVTRIAKLVMRAANA